MATVTTADALKTVAGLLAIEDLSTRERGLLAIRWHGRGGSGAKTAAVLLAELAIAGGRFGQALPEFGPERRGAPVQAFTRLADRRIGQRGPIARPDVVVVLDPGLLDTAATREGIGPETIVFVNAPPDARRAVGSKVTGRLILVDASTAARAALGRDLPNVPMLAAVVGGLSVLAHDEFLRWLEDRLSREFRPEVVAGNVAAARGILAIVERPPAAARVGTEPQIAPAAAADTRGVLRWQDADAGPLIAGGTSRGFTTGDWRQQQPRLSLDRCVHCMLCWLYCPDSAIRTHDGRVTEIDLAYCKGCGICAEVCPPKARAIVMIEEGA